MNSVNEFVNKLNTSFSYIQATSKNLESYTTLPIGTYHDGNENLNLNIDTNIKNCKT